MRAVVQRVRRARVEVAGETVGAIEKGLCVFVATGKEDVEADLLYVVGKVLALRVFPDASGRMSVALDEAGGELLIVSQFTLYGDVRRGNRPGFDAAMPPEPAEAMIERFVDECRRRGARVATGRFRADMLVTIENDGPVTILIDSKKAF